MYQKKNQFYVETSRDLNVKNINFALTKHISRDNFKEIIDTLEDYKELEN